MDATEMERCGLNVNLSRYECCKSSKSGSSIELDSAPVVRLVSVGYCKSARVNIKLRRATIVSNTRYSSRSERIGHAHMR